MVLKLYLSRHGESISSDVDPNQPLSSKGVKESEWVAQLLKQAAPDIDEVMHSPKLRAKQTALIMAKILAPDLALIQRDDLKPTDPVEPILGEIRSFDRNVMIVSHLPFLEDLLSALLNLQGQKHGIELCGSCVICLNGEGKNWVIEWIVSPKLYSNFVDK